MLYFDTTGHLRSQVHASEDLRAGLASAKCTGSVISVSLRPSSGV
jgi:hypothetical protein